MIGNLSRRERTVVIAGAAIAVIVGGWLLVVQPALERAHAAAELVPARLQVLTRRQELVARKDTIAASLNATNARLDEMSQRFLTAGTPAVAASELQQTVKDIAAQASTEVRSAASPPALMPRTFPSTPKVGGHSAASSTPSLPLVPAPT